VWRRRAWWSLGAVVLVVVGYVAVIAVQVVTASRTDDPVAADAVVVLGAAQYDGTPSPALQARLDRAFELYESGLVPTVVLTGSKQPADRFTEAFAGYRYLAARGVADDALVIVDDGETTYDSLAAAARVLRDHGATDVLLVTDPYHNRRVEGIAREVGLNPRVTPTDRAASPTQLIGETGRVAVGELIGYRRLFNATS